MKILHIYIIFQIWDLSDTDADGFLSKEEFILVSIYKTTLDSLSSK